MNTATVVDETVLTPELAARLLKLAPEERRRAVELLDSAVAGPPDGPLPPLSDECKAEIRRRVDAYESGKEPGFTLEETLAFIRRNARLARRDCDRRPARA